MTQKTPVWIEENDPEIMLDDCACEAEVPRALSHRPFYRRHPIITATLSAIGVVLLVLGVISAVLIYQNGFNEKEFKKKLKRYF